PDQRKKISEIVDDFRPKIDPLRQKYKAKQGQFLDSMMGHSAPEEIMLKQQEMTDLYGRIINEYCAMNLKVRKLLSPVQCQKYEMYRHQQGWTQHK
ncbi:MAG: hypothetical protein ACRD3W_18445, partial [Terriglobales bacterium]